MPINASVGRGGRNDKADVCVVQAAINENVDRVVGSNRLVVDGLCGEKTHREIDRFQLQIEQTARPDGRIDPGGRTIGALAEGFEGELNASVLKGIMSAASQTGIALYLPFLAENMAGRKIDTPLRQAHFIAQLAHESGSFVYAEEIASGAAYEGRRDLGNTKKGDGRRFKGRGLIQLTGRANYTAYGNSIGEDLTVNDRWLTVATDPSRAVDVACWYWEDRKLNKPADKDDARTVTKLINGGLNGFEDRLAFLRRARYFLRA